MMKKKCELCNSPANMYCESDQASLCWSCDATVHGANFIVSKHSRTLLCHVCQSPTPWTASGRKLGPTVSVCENCSNSQNMASLENGEDDDDSDESSNDSDGLGDNNPNDEEDDNDSSGGGRGSGSGASGQDDGDNQVVPLSSPPPPPTDSSSSASEDSCGRICSGKESLLFSNLDCYGELFHSDLK